MTLNKSLGLGPTYDYLFKLIIIGDSSTGKSTLLHQFIHNEFVPKSHTVGVEFTSRILLLGASSPMPQQNAFPVTSASEERYDSDVTTSGGIPLSQTISSRGDGDRGGRSKRASAVKLQLWDTTGQEKFRSVTRNYYRGAAGALLVYDVTKRSTFDSLPRWLADVRSLAAENVMIVVVGNKTDLVSSGRSRSTPSTKASSETARISSSKREVEWEEGRRWAEQEGLLFAETSSLTGSNIESPFMLCARGIIDLIERGIVAPEDHGSGISYGDRLGTHSRSASETAAGVSRFSFADVMQSGSGSSLANNGGLVKLKEVFGVTHGGKCC